MKDSETKKPIIKIKPVEPSSNKGLSKADLFEAIEKVGDAREKVLSGMVNKLFDDESLLKIARLDNELTNYIIKHLIIDNFFLEYWTKISIEKKIIKSNIYPYYSFEYTEKFERLPKHIEKSYRRLINELLEVTISYQGQGRKEIMEIIKSMEARLIEDKINENRGIVSKILS